MKASILENCGLVIIHPFIQPLFRHLDILDQMNHITNMSLAIQILHYAATGNTSFSSSEMRFEKLLCGLSMDQPVKTPVELSTAYKEEVDGLLANTITHWSALKQTSISGLRDQFLKRQGNIISNDSSFTVVFERRAIDVLLDTLPWSIGIITFPWKNTLIQVEW